MRQWCVCGLLLVLLSSFCAAQIPANTPGEPSAAACSAEVQLTPEATQVAEEIGVTRQVEQLRQLSAACRPGEGPSLAEVALRQQIVSAVMVASLDVDGVLAQIAYERAQIMERRAVIDNRKNRTINLLTVANIVAGTGSGILTNALQFQDSTALAGDGIGVGGGVAGVLLSILGLRVQGGAIPLGIAPNMLAQFFARTPEVHSVYPADVWAWLNTAPVAYPRVRAPWREALIEDWVREKRIGPPDAEASQKQIRLLTSSIEERSRLPLDILASRSVMLMDVSARVALMKGALRDLLKGVSGDTRR